MTLTGVIKVLDVPDDACLTTVRDLLLQLERYLGVEFTADRVTNVYVSANEPDTTDRSIIWFKTNNAGNFVGIYLFIAGTWVQFLPVPQQLFRIVGDSTDIPAGYALADDSIPYITEDMATAIAETWIETSPGSGVYSVFDVVYVGL